MNGMFTFQFMTMGPVKHEKAAIFGTKMSGFRMFQSFESMKCEETRSISWGQILLTPTSLDIKEGRKIDPSFYPVVYGLTEEDDWTDEANWYKANPSLGHTMRSIDT